MDLGFDETEQMIRVSGAEFLAQEAGPALARSGDVEAFWRQVSELGWPGLAIPETHGGAGMGLAALGVLIEQWGAHLGQGPLFESSVLVAPLLEQAADERLAKEILPAIGDGSGSAAVAILEESAKWRSDDIHTAAVRTDTGWAITGEKRFVSYGESCANVLVAARTGDGADDISLFLVDRSSDGISSESLDHASGAPMSVLRFNETTVDEGRLVGEINSGCPLIESLMLRGAAFQSIQLAGLGRRVLEITTDYVKDRHQFGVPIGAFQAVQHHLADMAVSVRRVEHLARQAVWSVAEDSPEAEANVARAKMAASGLIPEVCWTAHQCHGAIGFTQEHDLHLYTRHALSWAAEFGDATVHSDRLASSLDLS